MSPDLKYLAVTNRLFDKVSFIDIDPLSATFHQLLHETPVGHLPSGIAWDPGNEDVFVCNEGSDSVSVVSAVSQLVRKVVTRGLHAPFAVVVTPRQNGFGSQSNVYYAYILDRAGKVSLYESGPNTVNGWGYDAIIGQTRFAFTNPKAMQPDPTNLASGVWVAHEGQLDSSGHPTGLGGGAVTRLVLSNLAPGVLPLNFLGLLTPNMRGKSIDVAQSIGSDQLTGIPLDLAFDDQVNIGALADGTTPINSKNLVRNVPNVGVRPTNFASRMFVAVRDAVTGVSSGVDVILLANGQRQDVNAFHAGTQSIPARGAAVVMDYFRQ
jgi:YVTN family beta-propeller protein